MVGVTVGSASVALAVRRRDGLAFDLSGEMVDAVAALPRSAGLTGMKSPVLGSCDMSSASASASASARNVVAAVAARGGADVDECCTRSFKSGVDTCAVNGDIVVVVGGTLGCGIGGARPALMANGVRNEGYMAVRASSCACAPT